MTRRADSPAAFSVGEAAAGSSRRRVPIYRSVMFLVVGTIALLVFILVQGDVRRRQRAMEQAKRHVATLAKRVGDAGALPLNLQPEPVPERQPGMFRVECLARQDALYLRKSNRRGIIAQTTPVLQMLALDGRAVIFIENGRFDVNCLKLPEFDERFAAQRDDIRRLADDARYAAPNGS